MKPTLIQRLLCNFSRPTVRVCLSLLLSAGGLCSSQAAFLNATAIVFASNGEASAPALIDDEQLSAPPSPDSTHDAAALSWTTAGSTRAQVVLDLGQTVDLTKIYLWNFQGDTTQGMKDIEIQVSPDSNYATAQFTAVARIILKEGGDQAQAFDLVATDARLVRVSGLSNFGHGFAVGLGAVRFETGDIQGSVPTVGLTSPLEGGIVPLGSDLQISANVADKDNDITKVEFFDGAKLLGTVTTTPYSFTVIGGLTFGEHEIRAVATDQSGKVGWWTANIAVREPVGGKLVQIDDEADIGEGVNQITYSEGWTLAPGNANDPRFKNNDHYSFTQGAYFEVKFVGTKIDIYATVASHHGLATAKIDDGAEVDINYQADQRGEQKFIWSSPELPNREHVLRVTVKGTAVVTADRFDVHVPTTRIVQLDDEADIGEGVNQITYSEGWTLAPGNANDPRFKNNDHYSFTQGAYFEVKFVGIKIELYATVASHHGLATAKIDDGAVVDINYQAEQRGEQKFIWSSPELPNREHILRVTVKGTAVVTADRFDVFVSETSGDLAAVSKIVSTRELFEVDFKDFGQSVVNAASLELSIDGQKVAPQTNKTGDTTAVTYRPPTLYTPGSQHQYEIHGTDTNGNAISSQGTFSIPSPPFSLAGLSGPKGSAGKWGFRQIWDAGLVNGLAGAVEAAGKADAGGFTGKVDDTSVSEINLGESSNAASGGYFPDDQPLPAELRGLTANDFVVIGHAYVKIPAAGDWTIGVHSDEGFGLRFIGARFGSVAGAGLLDGYYPEYMFNPNNTTDSNSRGILTNLAVGVYEIEFISYERTGGAYFEVYAAKGAYAADDETGDWLVIGAAGGLELVEGAPAAPQPPNLKGIVRNVDRIVITFTSSGEAAAHQLHESVDLKTWQVAAGATFEKDANNLYRVSVSVGSVPAKFYRLSLPGGNP